MTRYATVGQVAELCGVSVRLLHHWDDLELIQPSARSKKGYRLYSPDDIAQIQRALIYRETGMSLKNIKELLLCQDTEEEHLRRQLLLLQQSAQDLQKKIDAVTYLLENAMNNRPLSAEEKAEIMGKSWMSEWELEAQDQWGHTDDWNTTQEKQRAMTHKDWQQCRTEMDEIENKMAEACRTGVEPCSDEGCALAEMYRIVLSRWHFDITPAKHAIIAKGYTGDERFMHHYEARQNGLAAWVRAAVETNAQKHGVDIDHLTWE